MKSKLGILGSGQLAMMLLEAAKNIPEIQCFLYAGSPQDPAVSFADEDKIIYGSLHEKEKLTTFFRHVDTVTFESEFVSVPVLEECSKDIPVKFFPSLNSISILQDKLRQKESAFTAGIPAAKWIKKDSNESTVDFISNIKKSFGEFAVLKWSRNGYDGKGNLFLHPKTETQQVENFIAEGISKGAEIFAEERIEFKREVAVVACKGKQTIFYPFVESIQDEGICLEVFGPVNSTIDELQLDKIKSSLSLLLENLDYHGCLGCELFETTDGKLLLNELAPRVHNTGHYTQDACDVSQFENHMRAIAGLDIITPNVIDNFVMRNIIGKAGVVKDATAVPVSDKENIFVHWYNKNALSYRRKLGHVNTVGTNVNDMRDKLKTIDENWFNKAY